MTKNTFLPYLETSLRSEHINIFVLTFSVMKKNGLIRKLRLISEFIRPQTGKQIITIHILTNISRSKGNHTMKFGQLI